MLRIPYEQLIEKIVQQGEVSQDEVEQRIKKKMSQLSGLISKEGAAHIIANELNVKLFEEYSGKVALKNVLPGLRNIEVVGKVLQLYGVRDFQVSGRSGRVGNILLGDETGKLRVVLWGGATKDYETFKEGDVIRVQGSYSKENQGYVEVHANDRSVVQKNPEGISVDVKEIPQRHERKQIADITEGDSQVEVLATLVELSDPKFFEVCSECRKRVRPGDEGNLVCKDHESAPVTYSYVLNAFIDDGTENIRTVFFSDQLEKLFEKNAEEILKLREDADAIKSMKSALLGSPIKIKARATKNKLFETVELIVNALDLNPDPKQELERVA